MLGFTESSSPHHHHEADPPVPHRGQRVNLARPPLRRIFGVLVLAALLVLMPVWGATAATPAQEWDGGPGDTGASWRDYFDNFNSTEDDDPGGAARPDVTAIGPTTWRVHKPLDRKRAELSRAKGWSPQEGQTYYLKWTWSISSKQPISDRVEVFQWKTDDGGDIATSKQNYPFNLGYDGTSLSLNLYGPGEPDWREGRSINLRRTTAWKGKVKQGQEVDIVIGVTVSKDRDQGAVELWIDGELQQLSDGSTRMAHRTNDGVVVYPKWGIYNAASRAYDVSVDLQDLSIDQDRPGEAASTEPVGETYRLVNVGTGLTLDSNGTQLSVTADERGRDRKWRLLARPDGSYLIENYYPGRGILDSEPGGLVTVRSEEGRSGEDNRADRRWHLVQLDNGNYRLGLVHSGRGFLQSRGSGAPVGYADTTDASTEWKLIQSVSGE